MSIDRDLLLTYLRHQCTPDQTVLAGSGMPHDQLVQLAQQYFSPAARYVCTKLSLSPAARYMCTKLYFSPAAQYDCRQLY